MASDPPRKVTDADRATVFAAVAMISASLGAMKSDEERSRAMARACLDAADGEADVNRRIELYDFAWSFLQHARQKAVGP